MVGASGLPNENPVGLVVGVLGVEPNKNGVDLGASSFSLEVPNEKGGGLEAVSVSLAAPKEKGDGLAAASLSDAAKENGVDAETAGLATSAGGCPKENGLAAGAGLGTSAVAVAEGPNANRLEAGVATLGASAVALDGGPNENGVETGAAAGTAGSAFDVPKSDLASVLPTVPKKFGTAPELAGSTSEEVLGAAPNAGTAGGPNKLFGASGTESAGGVDLTEGAKGFEEGTAVGLSKENPVGAAVAALEGPKEKPDAIGAETLISGTAASAFSDGFLFPSQNGFSLSVAGTVVDEGKVKTGAVGGATGLDMSIDFSKVGMPLGAGVAWSGSRDGSEADSGGASANEKVGRDGSVGLSAKENDVGASAFSLRDWEASGLGASGTGAGFPREKGREEIGASLALVKSC